MPNYDKVYPFNDVAYDGTKELFKVTTEGNASGGDPAEVNLYPRRLFSIQPRLKSTVLPSTNYKKVLTIYLVNNATGKNIAKLGTVTIEDTSVGDILATVDVNGAQTIDVILTECAALTIN